jgi:hypothetical protein
MKRHALVAAFAFLGCADLAHPFHRAVAPSVRRAQATEQTRLSGRSTLAASELGTAVVVGSEGDLRHVLVGPLRVDVQGDRVTPADDAPPNAFQYALRGPRGWLFATAEGDLYASERFTGRLRPLRRLGMLRAAAQPAEFFTVDDQDGCVEPCAPPPPVDPRFPLVPEVFPSVGRIAMRVPLVGEILWSDGLSLHTLDLPGAVALAWSSASRGAAIVEYRTLVTTRDGGRTWREVDLGDELPRTLEGHDDGLFVETTAGMRRLGDDDALTPTAHAHAPDTAYGHASLDTSPLVARGYDRVASPEGALLTPHVVGDEFPWRPQRFTVRLPERVAPHDLRATVRPRGVASPFGTMRSRSVVRASDHPAIVSVTGAQAPAPSMTVAWRGEDARGPFSARLALRSTDALPEALDWETVTATRSALLVRSAVADPLAGAHDPGPRSTALYWLSSSGAQRLDFGLSSVSEAEGLALDDGGAVLVVHANHRFDVGGLPIARPMVPNTACVVVLAPDGSVRAQRCEAFRWFERRVAGLGERNNTWGLVMDDTATSHGLTFVALDGTRSAFGAWNEGSVSVCDAPSPDTQRLHLLLGDPRGFLGDGMPTGIRVSEASPDTDRFAYVRVVTFEHTAQGGSTCVRRVWGTRWLGNTDDDRTRWAALRLTARDGRLVGTWDDGQSIAAVAATIETP